MKINQIRPQDSIFLQSLTHIAKAPSKLYYIGKLPETRPPTLAVVGTRKPTNYGRAVTSQLVSRIAARGVTIVSGLALGVDAIAHQAALDCGGNTTAIIPSGLPNIQPRTNHSLAMRIVSSGGAVMSEYSVDDEVFINRWSFLERNRLVAGLSDAVLITEASERSGTLNTAMHALEQGKEVFVVPGNITSSQSVGCNNLIRQGATPVTSADQVLETLIPNLSSAQVKLALASDPIEVKIIEMIRAGVTDGDEIQRQTTINPTELNTHLTMLEVNGTIRSLGANQWSLR